MKYLTLILFILMGITLNAQAPIEGSTTTTEYATYISEGVNTPEYDLYANGNIVYTGKLIAIFLEESEFSEEVYWLVQTAPSEYFRLSTERYSIKAEEKPFKSEVEKLKDRIKELEKEKSTTTNNGNNGNGNNKKQ